MNHGNNKNQLIPILIINNLNNKNNNNKNNINNSNNKLFLKFRLNLFNLKIYTMYFQVKFRIIYFYHIIYRKNIRKFIIYHIQLKWKSKNQNLMVKSKDHLKTQNCQQYFKNRTS